MNLTYKRVKIPMPHCGECGEMLRGDNSYILPYECSCGTWQYDWKTYEFNLTTKKIEE